MLPSEEAQTELSLEVVTLKEANLSSVSEISWYLQDSDETQKAFHLYDYL